MNRIAAPDCQPAAIRLPDGVCVEFFGLPGSGKTTIAREVHAALSRPDPGLIFSPRLLGDETRTAMRIATKMRLIVSEAVRRGWTVGEVRAVLAIRQPRPRDKLRAVLTVATIRSLYAWLRRHRRGAVLDQGLLQAIWTVLLFADEDEKSGRLVAEMLKDPVHQARVYVLVETAPETCGERLATRPSRHSRLQEHGRATDHRLLRKADLLRRKIIADLRATCLPGRIITVDGSADPRISAAQIIDALRHIEPAAASADCGDDVGASIKPIAASPS